MRNQMVFKKLLFGFIIALLISIAAIAAQDEEVSITGAVTAWEWDDDNNVTAVAISTDDEDFVVAPDELGMELLELLDHKVEATGTVSINDNDEKIILVSEYTDLGLIEVEDEEVEPEAH